MKILRNAFALLMALCLSTTAFAAEDDPMMIIHGKTGTEESVEWVNTYLEDDGDYTQTDLFPAFKKVMPGDELSQTIYIQNDWNSKDFIRLSMMAVLHDEEGNPISEDVLSELKADERNKMESELAYMHDFLHQLTLTVKAGEETIYEGHPDELTKGFEDGEAYSFGKIRSGNTVKLDVTLSVPAELGNEYAGRIGEVDWKFIWSGHNDPRPDPDPKPEPKPDPEPEPEEPPVIIIPDPEIPLAPPDEPIPEAPKTGDESQTVLWAGVLGLGVAGMAFILLTGKKKKEET